MELNQYEESDIDNEDLPEGWRSKRDQDDLEEFLQQNWEQRAVFYDDGKVESRQQFLGFTGHLGIRTKKYIGTVVYNGEKLNIFPKVFRRRSSDYKTDKLDINHMMNNLVKWLDYCNRIAYPFISITTELTDSDNLKELFVSLYLGYVQSALERGLFFKYVEETEDISSIKGKFDVKDYIINKIPNGQADKFRCTYSNFEFDNMVNRIIKHTCKMILNITESDKSKKKVRNILVRLNEVSDYPCKPSDCDRIRLSKMNGNYRIIISMSKMFLLNQTSSYSIDRENSFCFLFPTDLLFEGFIGGFLQEVVKDKGGKAYLQKSDMNLISSFDIAGQEFGGAFNMRHDILVEFPKQTFILDTKYKMVSRFEGDNELAYTTVSSETHQGDIYQVCEYARMRNITDVYLLYPQFRYEDKDTSMPVGHSEGINIHFIRMPFIFEEDEQKTKDLLAEIINEIFKV